MSSSSSTPLCYPRDLNSSIISMRKNLDNKSLGRLLLAESYSNDLILLKKGYNPDVLRKQFNDLYKNHTFTEFSNDFFLDVSNEFHSNSKKKNNLEKILLEQFGYIPKGYITNIEENDIGIDICIENREKVSVVFILNTTEKIRFVKAIISIYEFDDCGIFKRIFENIEFEEITGRDAIDSIPGIGHIILDYDLKLIFQSL
jgi:hypothetical protein